MNCWNCGAPLGLTGKISFRAECENCRASLHCCRNCVYYKPGQPNDCLMPNTDYVADRSANNFCEEFKLLGKAPGKGPDPREIAKKLFGEEVSGEEDVDPKQRLKDLLGGD